MNAGVFMVAEAVPIAPAGAAQPERLTTIGKIAASALALVMIGLKMADLGQRKGWSVSLDPPFVGGVNWYADWVGIAIIALEGVAAAAVISIAFTYIFINNTFTTYVGGKIVNTVRHAVNAETKANIRDIAASVSQLRTEVAESIALIRKDVSAFEALLEARRADPEHLRLLDEFLQYARDNRIAQLEEKLKGDDQLLHRLAEALSAAIQDVRSR